MSGGLQPETAVTTDNHSRTIVRGTGVVSALTLLSRLLGFVRDVLVARLFGASYIADAFFVAFRIPNLLRSFVAEGALTSAFVPVFSQELRAGHERAQAALSAVGTLLFIATALISFLGIIGAELIVELFAPGFGADPAKLDLCVLLTQIMLPFIICVSFVAMLNGALNSARIFGAAAWAQVWMNVALIGGALFAGYYAERNAAIILAISVIIGGIIQVVVQLPALRRAGFHLYPTRAIATAPVKEVLRLMVPATIGAAVYQISIFLNTLLASLLEPGSVSWLFYADRVAQFPIGIFSVALASVLLPALSTASATDDSDGFQRRLGDSLRFTSFFIIPMAAGIWALALPITELLFERGAFSHESSIMTSYALKALAAGLWATSCHSMLVRAFIARKDTVTPTLIGLCSLAVTAVASLLLMGQIAAPAGGLVALLAQMQALLYAALPWRWSLGHVGLAAASSAAAFVSFALVAALFGLRIGRFPWRPFASSTLRSLGAAAAMVAALHVSVSLCSSAWMACLVGIPVGAVVYAGASLALRSPEAQESLRLVVRASQRIR